MPKKNLDEATIIRIEAEKKAVMEAAIAFREAKVNQDSNWPNTRKGKNFDKSMELAQPGNLSKKRTTMDVIKGYEAQPIYGRLIDGTEYGVAKKSAITRFFTGDYTSQELKVLDAQEKLLKAQKKLHNTMDTNFGTRVARVANEDRSLMQAGEFVTDLAKPFTSGAGDIKSMFLGKGELKTKPGSFGISIPTVDRGNLPKKAFLTPSFLHNRQGLPGIVGNVAEIFTQTMQATMEKGLMYGLGSFVGASGTAVFKITGNVLGMAFDAAKLVLRVPELFIRAAVATVAVPVLAAYKGIRGAYKSVRGFAEGMFGLERPDPDFSLKSHVDDQNLKNATDLEANNEKNQTIDAAIENNPEAKAASDAAKTAKAKEIDAANFRSGANRSPQQQIEINAAGREAGQKVLKEQVLNKAIAQDPTAKVAAEQAYKMVMNKTGLFGRELYKSKGAQKAAAVKAGREAGQAVIAKKDDAIKKDPDARAAATAAWDDTYKNTGSTEQANEAGRKAGRASLNDKADMERQEANRAETSHVEPDSEQSMTAQELSDRDFSQYEQIQPQQFDLESDDSDNISELTDDDEYSISVNIMPMSESSQTSAQQDLKASFDLDTLEEHNQVERRQAAPVKEENEVESAVRTGGPGSSPSSSS